MTILSLPQVDLYYEVHGDGPPLLLLHGAGGDHHCWWQQASALQEHYSVILVDLRGFGRSQPIGKHDPGDAVPLIDDVAALLDHLGFDSDVAVLGHSFGTIPALGFAARHPDRVRALILSSAYGLLRTDALAERIDQRERMFSSFPPAATVVEGLCRSPDEQEAFAMFYRQPHAFAPSTARDRPDLAFLYSAFAVGAKGPSLADLAPIFSSKAQVDAETAAALPFPVLVVGGAHDAIFTPDELADAARAFSRGRFVLFPQEGHSAYFENAPEFNKEIAQFLGE